MPHFITAAYSSDPAHFDEWREAFAQRVARVEIDTDDRSAFGISIGTLILPNLALSRHAGSAFRMTRTRSLLRDGDDALHFGICIGGRCEFRFGDEHVTLTPGTTTLFSSDRLGGTVVDTHVSTLQIRITRDVARTLAPALDRMLLGDVRPGDATRLVLTSYLDTLLATTDGLSPAMAALADNQLRELLAHLFNPASDLARSAAYGGVKAARLRAVLRVVAARFDDPSLNADRVGHRIGVSGRYVQRLMEGAGTSFSAHVRDLRLDQARRLLRDPLMAHKRIIDICEMAGFNDLSHFNRAFRARFGHTPKEERRGR